MAGVFHKLRKEIGDPADFVLPDWLSKWRPTPYRPIKRNIYVTKKTKRRQEDDGISCSCRPTTEYPGPCDKDCLCGCLLIRCLPKNGLIDPSCLYGCQCGSSCLNKPFHQRPLKKIKIAQTEKCGAGVVADENIQQGDFVIEYVGEVINDETCEERLWKMKHCGETNFYLCEINRDTIIDATYKGNKSRYINHSCYPNTEMQKWRIEGETSIGIFATRDIKKGEHLTYDYQFVQFGADEDCHCGAVGCRRKLGVKPNKLKTSASDAALEIVARRVAWVNATGVDSCGSLKVSAAGVSSGGVRSDTAVNKSSCNCIGEIVRLSRSVNRRSFGVVKRFDNVTKRHLIMFADGTVDVVDMSQEDWELL